ncbi:exo-alpha-sialidase [Roseimaritima ulvae]|uniref:Laminin G domain protein n=1 Tax=Roseimaritima ulvae TaxID=980254 RepID=A0A5B9QS24_9BACT|nr:exo-alpha-sialidase [Roseimaritima ulvae]QEG41848.1 Laminin G domain protein [Roseimaritima ulvae]
MKQRLVYLLASALLTSAGFAVEPGPTRSWTFDAASSEKLQPKGGSLAEAVGVHNQAMVLKGNSVLEVPNSSTVPNSQQPFSLVVWFNPYKLDGGQQMIVAKNCYALNQREWSVMIDDDQKLRLYVHQKGWKTAEANTTLQRGHWHQMGLVVGDETAELWLNGELADTVELTRSIPQTKAPLTFGGVDDNGRIRQNFTGALDQALLFDRSLSSAEMVSLYTPVKATHQIPDFAQPVRLWNDAVPLPVAADIPVLKDVRFQVIKKWDRETDGYTFLHGVGLGWHNNKLYASIGHNKGAENTVTEEAQYRVSEDQGQTWSELRVIDAGEEPDLAVSHGVFLSHGGKLWAFHGGYYNRMQNIHTRAYSLDEASGRWIKHGIVIRDGFWPMNQPVKMGDGNWIMPGMSAGPYSNSQVFPAAVAISHGDDFTKWDFVQIPNGQGVDRMWGESAIFVDGNRVFNVARYGGGASALLAISEDYGRTWTSSRISNLPMATSKPAAGTLSTGQRYLVCTTAKNNGGKRTPLTIALTAPGENVFEKVFVIRRSRHDNEPGESADRLSLSYPCAIEHNGHLYVGYSNNGGRRGNLNSAEMAIIPLQSLQQTP